MADHITPNVQALFGETDSETIQNAIAAAEAHGCRKVVIPRFNLRTGKNEWRIGTSIKLPSSFTLILDNCFMVQETGTYDNMFTNALSDKTPHTMDEEQHDITILGEGNVCLSGGEHNGLVEHTALRYGLPHVWVNTMFLWINVRNLRVENLHIQRHRWWAMTHLYCRDVKLKNIDFYAEPHVPNMDGIDLRVGCTGFEIENITGRTGDDTVAMTALSGRYERLCAVEGKPSDISHVKIRNVLSDPFRMLNVRVLNQDGNQVYDIDIDTVMDTSEFKSKAKPKAAIGIGTQGSVYTSMAHAQLEDTRQIHAQNIYTRGSIGVRFDEFCCDSTFRNVKTFNTNVVGISTSGVGCELRNIVFDGFYYSSNKLIHRIGTSANPEGYYPSVVRLPETTGDLTVRNLHVDGLQYLCELGSALKLTVEDSCVENITQLCKDRGEATVILNGKELADA